MGVIQNNFSNEILRIVEHKILQNDMEVKRDEEIRKIWNEKLREEIE